MTRRVLLSVVLTFIAFAASAQQKPPSPDEFLGYSMGERFTPYDRMLAYFDALTKSSNLITVEKIGETYENRPLVLATITSPKNRQALESIRRDVTALARGEGDATAIAAKSPAVVWLAFGVHGNESSSAEAAMYVASTLVRGEAPQNLLDDLVVIIDPLENPDGRERYVQWYKRTRGMKPNALGEAAEHQEPWPGGRFNHYLIDMNRDWAWQSQIETQARVAAYRLWSPQVFVDFHEMGYDSSYFFPPDARPRNAHLPEEVETWLDTFGKANAAEFTRRGWTFFVAEHFDLFYPAYGDSWPSLNGAIGMTYEMAGGGRAGLAIDRDDASTLTLNDRVLRHYTTAMTTLRTAAENRERLLRHTYQAAREQIDEGRNTFLLVPGTPNFDSLVAMLQRQGVRVDMLTSPVTLRATRIDRETPESRAFPAGTAVVSTRQALGRLANTLLEKAPALEKEFVEEQRTRAEADEPDEFYDLTTWSLPLAMNVEGWVTTTSPAGAVPYQKAAAPSLRPAGYAYLVSANEPQMYRLAGRLLERRVRFSVADSDIVVGDRTYPRGTLVIVKSSNGSDLDATLSALVGETGTQVVPIESGWAGGTALGSSKIRFVRDPKIGLVGGAGSFPTSFGMLWHTLDVDTPIPHATVFAESLRNLDLNRFEVLVFPDGNYADRLGKAGIERVKQWVNDGGTLVAVKGASAFLRDKEVGLSKLKAWEPPKKKDDDEVPATDKRYNDYRIPGAAFRTTMNDRSYLTFGVPQAPAVLVEGSDAFLPVEHKVDNILTIAGENPLISGIAWPESIERMKGSVYVVRERAGRGQVITFADDPHFRLFWRATLPIFLNAVLYSPTFAK